MLNQFLKRFFGSPQDKFMYGLDAIVDHINSLGPSFEALKDEDLRNKTSLFRQRFESGESLDHLLPEAFATVREASKRTLGLRHFDVQLKGAMVLHKGMIAEMKTGEGKTLVATLAAYLNAIPGKGVHLVTVNDYLATRDSEWMGQIYNFLGLSVGCVVHGLNDDQRRKAYQADITYGTNNEFGFDYLRDNMKFDTHQVCQRDFSYAIIDEVDSILIDEARTPLIISGPAEASSALYSLVNPLIVLLKETDYEKDEKSRSIILTEDGVDHIEKLLKEKNLLQGDSLYDIQNLSLLHHVSQALKAHKLFTRDIDYIVKNKKVIIIDEFTGRMMGGRRYSDGLHQAIEAKEKVPIEVENQTLASITFQNYFRLYKKLAGMTGTALTEESEFRDIYQLYVAVIPTHKPIKRQDLDDEVYRSFPEKLEAIIQLIESCRSRKQPVLVGTVSIEKSELFSSELKKRGIPHQVLNARYHETEAEIISEAGVPGAVTIATNMAGRGTDIQPGGNKELRLKRALAKITNAEERKNIEKKIIEEIEIQAQQVRESGGLYVIGTERHESRRIDNQLRGRTGRQGDVGTSKFFLSLSDDLMRIFGSERLENWLQKLGLQEGEAITHPWINRSLEKAQQKVESRNYEMRKHLLKYDDVMNEQRKAIYTQRTEWIKKSDVKEDIVHLREDVFHSLISQVIPEGSQSYQWNTTLLQEKLVSIFNIDFNLKSLCEDPYLQEQDLINSIRQTIQNSVDKQQALYGVEEIRLIEKSIFLRLLDKHWKEHLQSLDHLRQGVHLRAYAQTDPLNEYKQEAFSLFQLMITNLHEDVISSISHYKGSGNLAIDPLVLNLEDSFSNPIIPSDLTAVSSRNAPCLCGSGKRYKDCHGSLTQK